jgi:Sec-independent protein translocase protein TatA
MSFLLEFGLPELLIVLLIIWIYFGRGTRAKLAGSTGKGNRTSQDEKSVTEDKKG